MSPWVRRLAIISLVAAVVIGLRFYTESRTAVSGPVRTMATSSSSGIGGPFTLIDSVGRTVTDADFRGEFMMIYFGFTFCPDVCPTSLSLMAAVLDDAPESVRERVRPVFITIDPERDTPEAVGEYAAAFGERFVGLTGTDAQIEAVARAYKVYYNKVEEEGADYYLMDHSSIIYLVGPDGDLVSQFSPSTDRDVLVERLTEAVRSHGASQATRLTFPG